MNLFRTKIFAGMGILAFTGLVTGCSNDGYTHLLKPSESTLPNNIYANELISNHALLDIFYYDAHLKNELNPDVEVYYGLHNEENYNKGACTAEFSDVCGMYDQMSDKFTRYFDPAFAQYVMTSITETETIVGIGAEVTKRENDDFLEVSEVYPESPADLAGLQAGDVILDVDGSLPKTEDGFNKLTTGVKGETIRISILRGEDEIKLTIIMSEFLSPSVHLSYVDSIPVIKVDEFRENTIHEGGSYGEFYDILRKVVGSGAKSAIIDLRNNLGGDTEHCTNMASELLDRGDTIIIDMITNVDSVFRGGNYQYFQRFDTLTYTATSDGIGKDLYYVFLANDSSASCSEMMLSAITVNKFTPVVGQNTFGKGIGQYYIPTYAGGIAGITSLHSIDKNGASFHRFGIAPDYEISNPSKQMAKAVELAKERTKKRTAGYGKVSTGNFEKASAKPTSRREIFLEAGRFKFVNFKAN